MRTVIAFAALVLVAGPVQAATEYLRFEGSVAADYGPNLAFDYPYDAALGLTAGQAVFFDFSFDVALDAPGRPDTPYQDYFSASFLTGSVAPGFPGYGLTASFPEGINTWFFATPTLFMGTPYSASQFNERGIDTWVVGQGMKLMNKSYLNRWLGDLSLTYRGATPPPPIVPLPASGWLLATGLLALFRSLAKRGA